MYIQISFTSSSSNSTTSLTPLSCHGLSSLQSPQPTSDSYPRRLCERKINQYRDDILSNLWNAVFWPGIYICLNKFTIRIPLFFLKVIVCLTSQLLFTWKFCYSRKVYMESKSDPIFSKRTISMQIWKETCQVIAIDEYCVLRCEERII